MGISKQDELAMHAKLDSVSSPSSSLDLRSISRSKSPTYTVPFTTYDGTIITVPANPGDTLMQIAKAAGVPSIEGVCDGKLEVSRPSHLVSPFTHRARSSAQHVTYTSPPPHPSRLPQKPKKTCSSTPSAEERVTLG